MEICRLYLGSVTLYPPPRKQNWFVSGSKLHWATLDPWMIYPHPKWKTMFDLFHIKVTLGDTGHWTMQNNSHPANKTEQKLKHLG